MTDIYNLKNDIFRKAGRQVGYMAWEGLEKVTNWVAPWLIAGGLARNTDPTIKTVQDTARHYVDRATNFRPVSWAKNAYQWADGKVNRVLAFTDRTLNRLNIVPGYRFLTGFPLFLGHWADKYNQTKNFIVLKALWERTAEPVLNTHLFKPTAVYASSYVAPFADAMITYYDEKMREFLGASGATGYSLKAFSESWTGWLQGNMTTSLLNPQELVKGIYISAVGVERFAEQNLAFLNSASSNVIQAVHFATNQVCRPFQDMIRYGNCLYSDKGAMPCTQSALNHVASDYLAPVFHYVVTEDGYIKMAAKALNENSVTGAAIGFVGGVIQDWINYANCVYDGKIGLQVCTQDAAYSAFDKYAMPVWNVSTGLLKSGVDMSAEMFKTVIENTAQIAGNAVKEHPYVATASAAVLFGFAAYGAREGMRKLFAPVGVVNNNVVNNNIANGHQQPTILPVAGNGP